MKLSKILLFITTVLSALILTGCSDELTKLTSSEQSAVVSYSAHVVSLYNVNQKKGYVKLSDEYLKSVEKKEANGDGTITVPAEDDTKPDDADASTKVGTATQAIGISDLEVTYQELKLCSEFIGEIGRASCRERV